MTGTFFGLLCGGSLAALITAPAFAQDAGAAAPAQATEQSSDGSGLGEIIVTAQKRSENLQKVPVSVTAVSPEQLANTAVLSTTDLGSAVPGLIILNNGGILTPRLRGVGTTSTAPGAESPVAVYVDGVYYAFGADINVDASDVAQLSVLRGPQGTLFGRNATGGVVQFATRDPKKTFELSAVTSLDSYLTSRSNIFVGGPLTDTVRGSLSVAYATQGEGWGTNLFDGRDVHRIHHDFTIRGKLIYENGRTDAHLAFDYNNKRDDLSLNFRPFPGYSVANPSPQSSNLWDTNNYLPSLFTHKGGGGSLTINHDLDFAKLVSISAYREATALLSFESSATAVKNTNIAIPESSRQFTQELQLVSRNSSTFNWVIGAYYYWNRAKARLSLDVFPTPAFVTPILIRNSGTLDSDSVAGFAQGTYSVTPTTRLTGGFRYTYEHKRQFGSSNGVPVRNTLTFKKPSWRLSIDQDLARNVLAFASYNRGFKSGGLSTTSPATPSFQPEIIDAYEAGIKSQFLDNRVRLNLSGFYYDYKNIQVARVLNNAGVIYNADGAKIYGLDADIEAQLTDALHVNLSAEKLHTEFLNFPQAQFTIPKANNEGAIIIASQARGNRLPYAPKLTLTAGIDYTVRSTMGDFKLAAADSYNSGYYGEADNRLFQKSYHLVNLSVGWQSPSAAFGARLWLNNLLDKAVASQITSQLSGYIASYSNPPRTVGITLSAAIK